MNANYRRKGPDISTDIIIEYGSKEKEGIVLITRKYPPYGLALPGGHAEIGIPLEANAKKEAKEETNLEVLIEDGEKPFLVLSDPARDPRTHMVTVVYIAKGFGILRAGDDAAGAGLYTPQEVKGMFGKDHFAFDHEKIIRSYLKQRGLLE